MNKELMVRLHSKFDGIANIWPDSEVEFWYARDLQEILGYTEWRNFLKVVEKAKEACSNAGANTENHFVDVNKMVPIGSGAERPIEDIMLTRYACYLIAQNGDPRKDQIAFAQSYFAIQTRKQEIIEERIRLHERLHARQKLRESETELSKNIYERGVDEQGFGRIRSKGDAALFGPIFQKGAKNTINITNSTFLSNKLVLPVCDDETKAITEILTTARQEISLLKKRADALRRQKRGLMQKLLAGAWRVKTGKEEV